MCFEWPELGRYGWRWGQTGNTMEQEGFALGLAQALLGEGILVLAAGLTFFGGIPGLAVSAALLSVLNVMQPWHGFWLREGILLLVAGFAALLLVWVNRKAKAYGLVNGVAGSIISLAIFAVFVTPILALAVWALILGTGMIPHMHKKQVYWSFAPTVIRVVTGIGWIIVGNLLVL